MRYGSATNTGLRSLYNICHKLKSITAEVKKFNDMSIGQIAHMSSSKVKGNLTYQYRGSQNTSNNNMH